MELFSSLDAIETGIAELENLDLTPFDRLTLAPAALRSQRLAGRLRAVCARILIEADAAGVAIGSGSRDTATWLADHTHASIGEARDQIRLGDALTAAPALASAIAAEEVSVATVESVLPVINDPDLPTGDTAHTLLPSLIGVGPRQARRLADEHRARELSGQQAQERRAAQYRRRSLRFCSLGDGMVEGRLLLPEHEARVIRNTISHLTGVPTVDDERTTDQRAADALVALCDAHATGTITGGREKPTIVFVHRAGHTTNTFGEQATSSEITQACCDSETIDITTDADGNVLDVGRATRTVSRRQWLALVVRDQRCRWPSCERPPGWCDAHHITEWEHGGHTNLDNLVLLCRHHHTTTHLPHTHITGNARLLTITLPNGSTLTSTPPRTTTPAPPGDDHHHTPDTPDTLFDAAS